MVTLTFGFMSSTSFHSLFCTKLFFNFASCIILRMDILLHFLIIFDDDDNVNGDPWNGYAAIDMVIIVIITALSLQHACLRRIFLIYVVYQDAPKNQS